MNTTASETTALERIPVRLFAARKKVSVWIVFSVCCLGIGSYWLLSGTTIINSRPTVPWLVSVIGWVFGVTKSGAAEILVCVTGVMCVIASMVATSNLLRILLRRQPVLLIDEHGVHDHSIGIRYGFISWEEIYSMNLERFRGTLYLTITPKDLDSFRQRLGLMKRMLFLLRASPVLRINLGFVVDMQEDHLSAILNPWISAATRRPNAGIENPVKGVGAQRDSE